MRAAYEVGPIGYGLAAIGCLVGAGRSSARGELFSYLSFAPEFAKRLIELGEPMLSAGPDSATTTARGSGAASHPLSDVDWLHA